MTKDCSSCGYENENDALYCRSCGVPLVETQARSTQDIREALEVAASQPNTVGQYPSGVTKKLRSAFGSIRGGQAGQGLDSAPEQESGHVAYDSLVKKIEKLSKMNRTLEEELHATKEKIGQIEKSVTDYNAEADLDLRGIRAAMARLLEKGD
jgi:hypothetical protein